MKIISLPDILTPREIKRAKEIYRTPDPESFNQRCVREIVEPNMSRINAKLGQENDSRFIGYAIEYCLMTEKHKRRVVKKVKKWRH